MEYFSASFSVSFRRWYDFFSEFDKQIDEAIAGSERSDHAEDYVEADLIILLKKMKAIKEKIEADLNAD